MENVPLEAWKEDDIKLILRDAYVFDRLDSRTPGVISVSLITNWPNGQSDPLTAS